jgi:Holliday junction resolvase
VTRFVVRGSSGYERELRDLLQGEPAAIRAYCRALPKEDARTLETLIERPFLVVRAAGSHGFDLVALRRQFAFPVEVKTSSRTAIRFSNSPRNAEQLKAHTAAVRRVGLVVLYAYRKIGHRTGDPWRVYTPTAPPEKGIVGLVGKRLPKIDETRNGNAVLRWSDGLPLVEFLRQVLALSDPTARGE